MKEESIPKATIWNSIDNLEFPISPCGIFYLMNFMLGIEILTNSLFSICLIPFRLVVKPISLKL